MREYLLWRIIASILYLLQIFDATDSMDTLKVLLQISLQVSGGDTEISSLGMLEFFTTLKCNLQLKFIES